MRHLPIRLFLAALSLCATGSLSAQQAAMLQQGAISGKPGKALDRINLDTTCAACTDFYTFANGGWLKRSTIPAAYPEWSAFFELHDKNEAVVHDVIEASAKEAREGKAAPGSNVYKIGAYYDACMDTVAIEKLGTKPIEATAARIAAIKSIDQLPAALAELEKTDGLAPFGVGAGPDLKNSNRLVTNAGQGGLSLPEKNYYLSADTSMKKIRDAFVAHVANMFQLYGENATDAKAHAQTVLDIETKFAQASMDRVAMRNPTALYHIMTIAQFDSLTPHIKWESFLAAQGAPKATEINVGQPEFFKAMDGLLVSVPLDDWKTLLRWRLLSASASALPKQFADERFSFQRLFTGQRERLPRWKSCTSNTMNTLGEAVGQEYVKRTFTPEAKARAKAIVDNMVSVLHDQIGQLDWMSDSTKKQALAKLDAFTRKIGYPDKWRDYSKLEVARGEYYGNLHRATSWATTVNWNKLGKPVDKSDWQITPDQVNAYYNPLWNEIVFPAGILQPPFFDPNADDAVNYGAMGAVIGHEMSHGFDDQGRRFDAQGNLRDWWTKDDADKYNAQAQRVVDQFNAYTIVDSTTHVNGKLTLGENIGDLGGLKIAYIAMEKAMKTKGRQPNIDGFTPEQRYFLGWAQVWRTLQRDEAAKAQVNTNPHAPAKWRVNGPLSNMPEFKAAWGCKDGDPMVRPEALRARIW
ncbi:MAG TPA: M13 family metallopeptidase [Gemmatimonadaceae bacterium]|jgi:putative endopeptidase|nr:M13 family metallopeptidase [Gemmatimonadaceae bacterium]